MNSTAQFPAAAQTATSAGAPQPTARFAPQDAPQTTAASPDRARAFAITSFVLGIVSVVSGWTVVAPLIGLVLGAKALRRETSERTLALWGVWLNAIMLALAALTVLVFAVIAAFGLIALPFTV